MNYGINNTTSVKQTMGQRLKSAREKAGLTRQGLADKLNNRSDRPVTNRKPEEMQVERLKQWEYGNNPISLEWIPLLCDALSFDVGYLFGDYDELCRESSDIVKEIGLTEDAVIKLRDISTRNSGTGRADVLSLLIEDSDFCYFLALLEAKMIQVNTRSDYVISTAKITAYQEEVTDYAISKSIGEISERIKPAYLKRCRPEAERAMYRFVYSLFDEGKIAVDQYNEIVKEYDAGNFDFSPFENGGSNNGKKK